MAERTEQTEQEKERNYEFLITIAVADTFHFMVDGKWCKCKACGKRLSRTFSGRGVNERMIDHSRIHMNRGEY